MGKRVLIEVSPDTDAPGDILGYTKNGLAIRLVGGGAVTPANVANWIPIEYDDQVVQRVRLESAVERFGYPHRMTSKTKQVPRSAGMTVSVGTTYTDDASTNDFVLLTARRFIARFSIDEDDLADANSVVDVITTKGEDWAISYADTFDNACLAVTGTENGTTVPFTSVYKALRTTNASTGYTADANYKNWSVAASGYDMLSNTMGLVEQGKYWSQADALVVAHTAFRQSLRGIKDAQNRPIFIAGLNGTPDTLFDVPIAWSRGCKTSPTNTGTPAGNPLLIVGNRRFLKRGDRSGPETLTDNARAQDDNDNYSVKFRTRKGFAVGHEAALAVLENTGGF